MIWSRRESLPFCEQLPKGQCPLVISPRTVKMMVVRFHSPRNLNSHYEWCNHISISEHDMSHMTRPRNSRTFQGKFEILCQYLPGPNWIETFYYHESPEVNSHLPCLLKYCPIVCTVPPMIGIMYTQSGMISNTGSCVHENGSLHY